MPDSCVMAAFRAEFGRQEPANVQTLKLHEIHRCIFVGHFLELGKLRLNICPHPPPSAGSSLGNWTDIVCMEPKAGCSESHQEACSVFPLLGPAHADFWGLWVKEADDLEEGAQALDQDGSGFAACFCHEAQCMISLWSLPCRHRGQEGLLWISVSVKGKGHTRGWAVSVEAQLALRAFLRVGWPFRAVLS